MEDDQRLHTLVHEDEVTLYGLRFTIARSRKSAVTTNIIIIGKECAELVYMCDQTIW